MHRIITALVTLGVAATATAQMTAPPVAITAPGHGPKVCFSSVNAGGPYVALTFDDGPNPTLTPRLLEILAKHNVKVTFFVLGECAHANPEVLKREKAEGHEIANHSWSHPNLAKMSDEGVRGQLQRTQDIITQLTGTKPTLMRPPYGAFSERQKRWAADTFGYKVILWAVDPLDWKRPGPSVVAKRIISQTRPGYIILMHDIHPGSIDAVPQILEGLQAKGFKFVTVSQLLAMDQSQKPKGAPAPAAPVKTSDATPAGPSTPVATQPSSTQPPVAVHSGTATVAPAEGKSGGAPAAL